MIHRSLFPAVVVFAALVEVVPGAAVAGSYNYGSSGGYGGGDAGFILSVEGIMANARNADNVVATINSGGVLFPIIPPWGDDPAGRIGLGYRFASGERVMLTAWAFETSVDAAGSGSFELPIGPAIGSAYDLTTQITARTVDAAWSVPHEASESFGFLWSVGVRWATFEETTEGRYTVGGGSQAAFKANKGQMLGGRLAGRATYRRGAFDVGTGLGMSLLSGDLEASATLTPGTATSVDTLQTDDGRSGTIVDFDLTAGWHNSTESLRFYAGWEQAVWQDIAADLVRNLPGTGAPLRDRDAVTFSGFKLGAEFRF